MPLAGLAVLFLVAYSIDVLATGWPRPVRSSAEIADLVIWVCFAIDYAVRLWLARTWRYFVTHLHDLALVALPALRPLRLLRLLMLLRVLNRRGVSSLHGRVAAYVVGAATVLLYCASLAVLDAERHASGANIKTFGNAAWWSIVTVSTVGYGDHYPVTFSGRLVAVGLMLGGIAIIGVVTATFATWLVDRVREVADAEQQVTRTDVDELRQEIRDLKALVARATERPPIDLPEAAEPDRA